MNKPLSAAGMSLPVRIYFEDTDAGGIVYHASYLRFMERSRTEFLRNHGIEHARIMAETSVALVVRKMTINYIAPAFLDDLLDVTSAVKAVGGASVTLEQLVIRNNTVICSANVVIVAVKEGKAVRLPEPMRSAVEAASR